MTLLTELYQILREKEEEDSKKADAPEGDEPPIADTEIEDQEPTEDDAETDNKDEPAETPAETDEADEEDSEDEEESGEDVGSVAEEEGFEKGTKEAYMAGKTRKVTTLTKNEELGGLDITLQYIINPQTGAWSLRACLAGQSEEDMVEFHTGEDPSSLIKSLKKKKKITPHQAVEYLNPPADKALIDK